MVDHDRRDGLADEAAIDLAIEAALTAIGSQLALAIDAVSPDARVWQRLDDSIAREARSARETRRSPTDRGGGA
jgi:hypothetical protein